MQLALSGALSRRTRRTAAPSVSGLQDWINRSTHADVFRAIRFDAGSAVDNFRFSSGIGHNPSPGDGTTGSYVRRNATEGILGDGALELEQLSSGNMNSDWWLPFDSSKSTWQFNETGYNRGPGQEFWMQVRFKTNCGGVGTGGAGQGRKGFSVTRLTSSYTHNEIVYEDTSYRGVYQMYQGFGRDTGGSLIAYNPLYTSAGGGDFNFQPGSEHAISPAFCSYQGGNYYNQAACWNLHNDQWVTYLWHIIPSDDATGNGTVEVWAWVPGMSDYVLIYRRTSLEMYYDDDKPDGYNAMICWIYETDRTSGPSNQKQWYDQVILSTSPIAVPVV